MASPLKTLVTLHAPRHSSSMFFSLRSSLYGVHCCRMVACIAQKQKQQQLLLLLRVMGLHDRAVGGRFNSSSGDGDRSIERSTVASDARMTLTSGGEVDRKRSRVMVIAGPTAVGKSRVALEVASRLGGEIIGADSVQVHKGLDVGSAKTPPKDRQGIPHHLIDILEPNEDYCAGDYFQDSREATAHVIANGHVPIVVGGTGLYLHWFVYGMPGTPKSTIDTRALVETELSEFLKNGGSWDDAMQWLCKAGDVDASTRISRNDWYRLRRSLEIIKTTGVPCMAYGSSSLLPKIQHVSELPATSKGLLPTENQHTAMSELDYDFMCVFLCNPRSKLYRCIDLRCEQMLTGTMGLLREASWLLDLGILPNSNTVSRAIGYRQAMEYLMVCRSAGGLSSKNEFFSFLSEFQRASRKYAKRQLTWFRNETLYHWIDASQPMEDVVEFLVQAYKDPATIAIAHQIGVTLKEPNHEEQKLLKAYKTHNRYFVKPDDCIPVLEWIKKTQICRR